MVFCFYVDKGSDVPHFCVELLLYMYSINSMIFHFPQQQVTTTFLFHVPQTSISFLLLFCPPVPLVHFVCFVAWRGWGVDWGGGGGVQIFKNVDLTGAGDLLASSRLARGYAKCMYSRLSEQTLRRGRFDEQRADCLKAKASLALGVFFWKKQMLILAHNGQPPKHFNIYYCLSASPPPRCSPSNARQTATRPKDTNLNTRMHPSTPPPPAYSGDVPAS